MKILKNKDVPEQRRILVETPQLVYLFDLFATLLRHERGDEDQDIAIDFDEMVPELDSVLGDIVEAVCDRISTDSLSSLFTNLKTGEMEVVEGTILQVLDKLIKEDKDGLMAILGMALKYTLAEAAKSIMDDVIQQGEFSNLKNIKIKTRRHVVVLC